MVELVTVYACDICKLRYDTETEALKCEAQGVIDLDTSPKVGDRVVCGQQGWWDGKEEWCRRVEGKTYLDHGKQPLIEGIWVVVKAELESTRHHGNGHLMRYWLWTDSARHNQPLLSTTSAWHIRPEIIGHVEPAQLAEFQAKAEAFRKEHHDAPYLA